MRRAFVLVGVLLACVPTARGDELPPEARAFVEWAPSRTEVWAGEVFRLRLRVGVDRAWFQEHAVPLHAQPMDLPVEVEAAGWPALPGTTVLTDLASAEAGARTKQRFVLAGTAVEGLVVDDVARAGRTFAVVEVERRVSVAEAAALALPALTLKFAHASRFVSDALGERVPTDRSETVVRGPAGTLTVRALPTEGRPADFAGAVGRFTLTASADRAEIWVSEPFRLTLVGEGRGNLEAVALPQVGVLAGFHVYGVTDDHGAARRTVVYEMAALRAGPAEVPSIALPFFDPGPPARYDAARSAPIPLSVRSRASVTDSGHETDGEPSGNVRVPPWALALTVGVLVGLIAAGGARFRRSRRRSTDSPSLVRRRAALAALRTQSARPGADLAPAFTEVLAAHLGVPHAAAIGMDVAARLARTGAAPEVAARATEILERLVAARYGGEPAGADVTAAALATAELLCQ